MKTTKFYFMLSAFAVLISCQKDFDAVNNQEHQTSDSHNLSQSDKDARVGMEISLRMIELYTDSLVNVTHNNLKHYYDSLFHYHESLFRHHHRNYSHNNEHDNHHHDNAGNQNEQHNNNHDSLHLNNWHGQHHHNDHSNYHNNHGSHHQGHHVGHHETLDSLIHVHDNHHP